MLPQLSSRVKGKKALAASQYYRYFRHNTYPDNASLFFLNLGQNFLRIGSFVFMRSL